MASKSQNGAKNLKNLIFAAKWPIFNGYANTYMRLFVLVMSIKPFLIERQHLSFSSSYQCHPSMQTSRDGNPQNYGNFSNCNPMGSRSA
jgi:hypothetical protein